MSDQKTGWTEAMVDEVIKKWPNEQGWTPEYVQDVTEASMSFCRIIAAAHNAAIAAAIKAAVQRTLSNCEGQLAAEREKVRLLAGALDEFLRVMEHPKTTASMPHTVAKAKAALAKVKEGKFGQNKIKEGE